MSIVMSFLNYCFVSGITPGPANICSLSTAIRKGRTVALRQWRGLFAGYMTVSLLSALLTWLIGTAFSKYIRYFTVFGAVYILWLAYHVLMDKPDNLNKNTEEGETRRLKEGTFLFGFILQLTNVKIIIFCLTALTGFVLPYRTDLLSLLAVGLVLPFTGPICNLAWLFTGAALQKFFEKNYRIVNTVMAVSLMYCAISMLRI